jgi:hypothetical protein
MREMVKEMACIRTPSLGYQWVYHWTLANEGRWKEEAKERKYMRQKWTE